MNGLRWLVEVKPDSFEDVGAAHLDVDGGCLVFRSEIGTVLVAYAVGSWLTVSSEDAQ